MTGHLVFLPCPMTKGDYAILLSIYLFIRSYMCVQSNAKSGERILIKSFRVVPRSYLGGVLGVGLVSHEQEGVF